MALPSRDQTFAFADCRELLEKLDRELDRFRDVVGRDEDEPDAQMNLVDQLKDSAFNASVTAWHLCDWVFNDMTPEQRQKLGFRELGDLQRHARDSCRALYLCRQVATASKHWSVVSHPDPTVQVIVTGEAGWTINFVDGKEKTPADQVFMSALSFWTEFIYGHHIAETMDDADAPV